MEVGRGHLSLAQLWQFPLLLFSLLLFGTAAYLFVNPTEGLTINQRIESASRYLEFQRPEAAVEELRQLLAMQKPGAAEEGRVHLLMAEALEQSKRLHRGATADISRNIIEQTRLALGQGIRPNAQMYCRLGDSFKDLNQPREAIDNYRKAADLDPRRGTDLQRRIIEIQLDDPDPKAAEASLAQYLRDTKLAGTERAWGLQRQAQLRIVSRDFVEAESLLKQSLRVTADSTARGDSDYRLGYCAWKMGDTVEAERFLRTATAELPPGDPLQAEAAYALGRIRQEQNDPQGAEKYFQAALTDAAHSSVAALAQLGRAQCRIILDRDSQGMADLHELCSRLASGTVARSQVQQLIEGISHCSELLLAQEKFEAALQVMADEQRTGGELGGEFFNRLVSAYEKRADQLEQGIGPESPPAQRTGIQQQARELREKGADTAVAAASKSNLDAEGRAALLWKGIELYDRVGDLQHVVYALDLFTSRHPGSEQAPDALLRLGIAFQSMGLQDKAIDTLIRLRQKYGRSAAAAKGAVALAHSYVSKGPGFYDQAGKSLQAALTSPLIDPQDPQVGDLLFDLGRLQYEAGRYEQSVSLLKEMIGRSPEDPRKLQALFLTAESYRRSAKEMSAASEDGAADQLSRAAGRIDRLNQAIGVYDQLSAGRSGAAADKSETRFVKLAAFHRADCLFDLGRFADSIEAYEEAATRFPDDPQTLTALVQIANGYCELGKWDQAHQASDRVRALLAKLPAEALQDGSVSLPRECWQRWLNWTSSPQMGAASASKRLGSERLVAGANH